MNATVAPTRCWPSTPSLGNIEAYISAVNRMPMLTPQEEVEYAQRAQDGDREASDRLIKSHLRLVVAHARKYLGYGLPHADLIQEGNIGLMKAVARFDVAQGVRLVTYAVAWIKAEICEYIHRNWRLVRVVTTKAQRKLFFRLRALKHQLQRDDMNRGRADGALTTQQVAKIAETLEVPAREVREMELRMSGEDVCLDPSSGEDGEDTGFAPIQYLTDTTHEPTAVLQARDRERLIVHGIPLALSALDERSRHIVEQRWMNVGDDGRGGSTLQSLGDEYGVSAERIRQIESLAMQKMRAALAEYA